MAQYAFYFDSNKCSGCKTCQVACKETYKLPVNNLYRKVLNYQGGTWELNEAGSYVPNGVFGYFVSMVIGAMNLTEMPGEPAAQESEARHRMELPRT